MLWRTSFLLYSIGSFDLFVSVRDIAERSVDKDGVIELLLHIHGAFKCVPERSGKNGNLFGDLQLAPRSFDQSLELNPPRCERT
jgi:hypothetical protein